MSVAAAERVSQSAIERWYSRRCAPVDLRHRLTGRDAARHLQFAECQRFGAPRSCFAPLFRAMSSGSADGSNAALARESAVVRAGGGVKLASHFVAPRILADFRVLREAGKNARARGCGYMAGATTRHDWQPYGQWLAGRGMRGTDDPGETLRRVYSRMRRPWSGDARRGRKRIRC